MQNFSLDGVTISIDCLTQLSEDTFLCLGKGSVNAHGNKLRPGRSAISPLMVSEDRLQRINLQSTSAHDPEVQEATSNQTTPTSMQDCNKHTDLISNRERQRINSD